MSQSGIKVEWVLRGASVPGGEDAGADDLELDFFFFGQVRRRRSTSRERSTCRRGQRRRVSAAGEEAN